MKHCHLEFVPKDEQALQRAQALLTAIQAAKESGGDIETTAFAGYLLEAERSYFWNPSADEARQWHEHWVATRLEIRLSPQMIAPQWELESMLDALCNGEYDLLGLQLEHGKYYLAFNPHAYPFGGTDCMVALLECFGHTVVGVDDGTGYRAHVPRTVFWQPRRDGR